MAGELNTLRSRENRVDYEIDAALYLIHEP
jgi:hypothetical protein